MTTITLEEMQRDFPGYFHRVQSGETLRVTDSNRPAMEIKLAEQPSPKPSLRPFGLNAGEFTVPDDFDAPLPEETLREFEPTRLSDQDFERFVQLMTTDTEPPETALREAAAFNQGHMDGLRYRW